MLQHEKSRVKKRVGSWNEPILYLEKVQYRFIVPFREVQYHSRKGTMKNEEFHHYSTIVLFNYKLRPMVAH